MPNKLIIPIGTNDGTNIISDKCEITMPDPSKCFMLHCLQDGIIPVTVRINTETGHINKDANICGDCHRILTQGV